ncbi:MAG TPA: SMC family ATPase [Acidimicrobiia bacterium]|nr:SMC family ATPase [Acidimicrobiia bacterium]
MRPLALTLKGFGIFSEHTVIDFTDAELFALTGPTGSGKTTILDGICFALYGAVPRHGEGAVAPIVNQQVNEATVGLTFSVHEQTYQVARRVRKSEKGKGASTGEASLERDGTVLVAGATNVTAQIEKLLGLDFSQFTTCVLVPQGEFARFLHEQPRHRQSLLSAILDLGLYDVVASLASGRAKEADGRLAVHTARLAELARITDVDLESLKTRKKELETLATRLATAFSDLEELRTRHARATSGAEEAKAARTLLTELAPPAGWKKFSAEAATLAAQEAAARLDVEEASARHAELAITALPARSQVERFIKARNELAVVVEQRVEFEASLAEQTTTAAQLRDEFETQVAADRAAHLRLGLKVGDPCPVCGERIKELAPSTKAGAHAKQIEKARKLVDEASSALSDLQGKLAEATTRQRALESELEGAAMVSELSEQLQAIASHEEALRSARARLAAAQAQIEQLRKGREQLDAKSVKLRTELGERVSKLAYLEPPLLDLGQPTAAWEVLLAWRDQRLPQVDKQLEEATREVSEAGERVDAAVTAIFEDLTEAGLANDIGRARETIATALAELGRDIKSVEEAREETERVAVEREMAVTQRDVAKKLASELAANKFKKWIFDEVFAALVAGANLRLTALTSGQYELTVTNNDFEVIDHFAADHRRGVKSLSGGETFLVSLAMAVALADEVAAAAGHRVALDSLFLDEGFGTLDNESLEVVGRVIAELGEGGKVVGIVTHVEELAAQMPVRYEVRRVGNSAKVTQVSE